MKPFEIANIRSQIKAVLELKGYTIAGIAREIDNSPSTLSLFISDKYTGDNEKVARALKAFLERMKDRADSPDITIDFQPTRNAKRIHEVCRICHVEGEIGVVYGPAGLGKTISAKQYAADNAGVIYIEVDPSFSASSIIKELHRKLGGDGKGGLYDLFQDIIHRLSDTKRLLIVDQAEILPKKGIELIRSINDKTGVGVVMLGMDALRNNIKGLKGEFAQLYSRIGLAIRLKEFTDDDIKLVVNHSIPSSNGLYKTFARHTRNGRTLSKLIKRAKLMAKNNNRKPDDLVVQESFKLLEV